LLNDQTRNRNKSDDMDHYLLSILTCIHEGYLFTAIVKKTTNIYITSSFFINFLKAALVLIEIYSLTLTKLN
jgi:hypothetical protein